VIPIIKNIFSILLQNKQKEFILLIGLMSLLSILELVGLGMLIPLINIISHPDNFINNKYIAMINNLFHFTNSSYIILLLLVLLVLFFIFKALYSLWVIYKQQIFVNSMFKDLSVNILEHSMLLKYSEFRKKDKSLFLKDIINSSAYLSLCTFNILQLFTELFVLMGILIFMGFYIGFVNIIYVLIAIILLGIVFKSITQNISIYGQQRDAVMHDITKMATETLSGYKEIRNNNVLVEVIKSYEKKATPYVKIYAKFGVISNVPKVTLEAITALIIIGYLFYIFSVNIPLASVMQNLIVFAFVGLRTIPSLTKLLGASAQIKYFGTESDKFKKLFDINNDKYQYKDNLKDFESNIEFKNISYKYPSEKEFVLKDINFIIKKNKKYGFVGKSGSGKSTLFDIILGLTSPTSGEIVVDGRSFDTFENIDVTKLIGIVSQDIFILDDSFERNILFFDKVKNEKLLNEAIKGAQLTSFVNYDTEHVLGEAGKNLSGGQKQRVAIARALYKNKNILLLDEATSALDNETERNFINYLNSKQNHTVLIIAHRLTTVKDCDKIFVFKDGTIVDSGTYEALSKNSEEFKKLLNSGELNEE